jgi:branched-chain amino acid transport system permease protein
VTVAIGTSDLTQALNGLSYAALLFFLAAGLTVIFGLMNVANLAHGALYLLGGLVGISVMTSTGSFWLAILAGAVAAGVAGYVIDRGLLQRVRGRELPEVLLTLGLALIISDLSSSAWGSKSTSMPRPSYLTGTVDVGGSAYSRYQLFVIACAVGVGVALSVLHRRTKIGALIRAGVDDREMVGALGVNVGKLFTATFVLGCVLAGMGGVIGGAVLGLVPGEETQILLLALSVIIIGGVGSLAGAAVGSVFVGLVTVFGRVYLPEFSYFLLFAPVALVLMLRPQGLLGRAA